MKKWLKVEDIDNGTKARTFFAALTAVVGAYYTYQGILDDLLNKLGLGNASLIVALLAVIGMIVAEGAATYYNNDYSEEASVGTVVGRKLATDPTAVVEVIDGDATDEDEDDEDPDEEYDEIIEEGE